MSSPGSDDVRWVVHRREIKPVSSMLGMCPELRKGTRCPACGEEVVVRATANITPHFAHKSGDCIATSSPESDRHYRTKMHLYHELRRESGSGKALELSIPCRNGARWGGPKQCKSRRVVKWLERGWVDCKVEAKMDSRRPDLTLFLPGGSRVFIEVAASNVVKTSRARDLSSTSRGWIEVDARRDLYSGASPWTVKKRLRVEACCDELLYTCDECNGSSGAPVSNGDTTRVGRVVFSKVFDVYLPHGRRFRDAFVVRAYSVEPGGEGYALLTRERRSAVVYAKVDFPLTSEGAKTLDSCVRHEVRRFQERFLSTYDCQMPWVRGEIPSLDTNRTKKCSGSLPIRYEWDIAQGRWVPRRDGLPALWSR